MNFIKFVNRVSKFIFPNSQQNDKGFELPEGYELPKFEFPGSYNDGILEELDDGTLVELDDGTLEEEELYPDFKKFDSQNKTFGYYSYCEIKDFLNRAVTVIQKSDGNITTPIVTNSRSFKETAEKFIGFFQKYPQFAPLFGVIVDSRRNVLQFDFDNCYEEAEGIAGIIEGDTNHKFDVIEYKLELIEEIPEKPMYITEGLGFGCLSDAIEESFKYLGLSDNPEVRRLIEELRSLRSLTIDEHGLDELKQRPMEERRKIIDLYRKRIKYALKNLFNFLYKAKGKMGPISIILACIFDADPNSWLNRFLGGGITAEELGLYSGDMDWDNYPKINEDGWKMGWSPDDPNIEMDRYEIDPEKYDYDFGGEDYGLNLRNTDDSSDRRTNPVNCSDHPDDLFKNNILIEKLPKFFDPKLDKQFFDLLSQGPVPRSFFGIFEAVMLTGSIVTGFTAVALFCLTMKYVKHLIDAPKKKKDIRVDIESGGKELAEVKKEKKDKKKDKKPQKKKKRKNKKVKVMHRGKYGKKIYPSKRKKRNKKKKKVVKNKKKLVVNDSSSSSSSFFGKPHGYLDDGTISDEIPANWWWDDKTSSDSSETETETYFSSSSSSSEEGSTNKYDTTTTTGTSESEEEFTANKRCCFNKQEKYCQAPIFTEGVQPTVSPNHNSTLILSSK